MARRAAQRDIFPANFGFSGVETVRLVDRRTHYLPRQENVSAMSYQPGVDVGLRAPIWRYEGQNEHLRIAVAIGNDAYGEFPLVAEARYGFDVASATQYVIPFLELATTATSEESRLVAATLSGRLVAQALASLGPVNLPGAVLLDSIKK